MSTQFHRALPDELTVSVDGVLELDHDITERTAARVVVSMPDYIADALAHLLADAARVAEVFGGFPSTGLDAAALADALYAAATSGDYRCPREACRCRRGWHGPPDADGDNLEPFSDQGRCDAALLLLGPWGLLR